MTEPRIPDPTLMARLQLSVKGVDWAASLVAPWQHEQIEGGWSPNQQVWHLLATEREVYQKRITAILNEERPQLPFWDENQVMVDEYSPDKDIAQLAEEFMAERAKTVELLKDRAPEEWARTGLMYDGREVDLAWMAEAALHHALSHFAELLRQHGRFDTRQAQRWMAGEP